MAGTTVEDEIRIVGEDQMVQVNLPFEEESNDLMSSCLKDGKDVLMTSQDYLMVLACRGPDAFEVHIDFS